MSTAPVPEREPSLEELAESQGIKPFTEDDERFGMGAECWASDAEFDQWMEWLRQIRSEGRQAWPSA